MYTALLVPPELSAEVSGKGGGGRGGGGKENGGKGGGGKGSDGRGEKREKGASTSPPPPPSLPYYMHTSGYCGRTVPNGCTPVAVVHGTTLGHPRCERWRGGLGIKLL